MPCNRQNEPGLWIPSFALPLPSYLIAEAKSDSELDEKQKTRLTDPTTSSDYLSKRISNSHNNFPSLLNPIIQFQAQDSPKKDELRIESGGEYIYTPKQPRLSSPKAVILALKKKRIER